MPAEANLNAMNLYFDSINWTVAGRKIEIIKEDDQFNPQVGLQKAKKLVESDKVDLVVGMQASNVALAVLNYMKQQKAFYVVSGAGTDAITWDRYPYLFRTSISTYQLSTPMANYVYDNLGKEIVTTASDYAGGRDVIAQFKGPYVAKGGKVLKEIWPPLGTTDFSPYLTDIKSINPPVTYDFMPGADAVRFIQQYSEFGLKEKMPLTGFTIIDSQTVSALGKSAIGIISALTYTDTLDNPESKKFAADYQAKYKSAPDLFADYGYVAAQSARRSVEGDRWRYLQQGQARRGHEQGCSSMRRAGRSAWTRRRTIRSRTSTSPGRRSGDGISTKILAHGEGRRRTRARRSTERPGRKRRAVGHPRHCMELLVAQLLNGLVYGVLLFLMAAGLSLIFGLMNVVSLAHGSFFMLGAFFGLVDLSSSPAASGWRSSWRRSRWSRSAYRDGAACSCGRSIAAATWTRCC